MKYNSFKFHAFIKVSFLFVECRLLQKAAVGQYSVVYYIYELINISVNIHDFMT